MAFSHSRDINASNSTFTTVHGDVINYNASPMALEWLRKVSTPGALYDSTCSPPPCFDGTRERIIGLISEWVSNPDGRGICWICGPVRTGKSAIAQTISQRCANKGHLAATFFCSRGDTDRSNGKKVIRTIAYQLALSYPPLQDLIRIAVENNLLSLETSLPTLFQTLVVNPLIEIRSALPRMVVVIDGLHECDEESAKEIARLLCETVKTHDLPLQFLVTSRPMSHIEVPFVRSHYVVKSFALNDFDVHDDIRSFFSHRFEEIYENHSSVMYDVAKPWPTK
jgi:hypothetical protein